MNKRVWVRTPCACIYTLGTRGRCSEFSDGKTNERNAMMYSTEGVRDGGNARGSISPLCRAFRCREKYPEDDVFSVLA